MVPYWIPLLLLCREGHVRIVESSGLLLLVQVILEVRKTLLVCKGYAWTSICKSKKFLVQLIMVTDCNNPVPSYIHVSINELRT